MILIVAALVFVVVILILAAQLRAESNMPMLLTAKNSTPQLSLEQGMRWHLFLSHVWSTGQTSCLSIKHSLSSMLPTINTFLDVDDLMIADLLEKYVGQTQSVLFFLSEGYFMSRNSGREITAALEQRKPIVLVCDAMLDDPSVLSHRRHE
eukprot:1694691-Prymnesium_polylepis.1